MVVDLEVDASVANNGLMDKHLAKFTDNTAPVALTAKEQPVPGSKKGIQWTDASVVPETTAVAFKVSPKVQQFMTRSQEGGQKHLCCYCCMLFKGWQCFRC